MCGIFGTVNFRVDNDVEVVFSSLKHRGPDQQHHTDIQDVRFFHTRLAIQDLSENGRQPMEHNGLFITFNGEIYNHRELRTKHHLSHPFRSDTMTILLMYEKMGMAMLEEFDGMFAFSIYDTKKQKLFLVRDRAGKKPLYIWKHTDKLAFSSELNALVQLTSPTINPQSIAEYLYMGYCFRERTAYKEIVELDGGSYIEIELPSLDLKKKKWFDFTQTYLRTTSPKKSEALEQLDSILRRSVQNRLESSDVEVGTFLSGGIDSGLITAIASEYKEKLKTFTIALPGSYDESSLANLVALKYNTQHSTISISFDSLKDDFEKIVTSYGEPFKESSAIPSYYVAKAAKEKITVVLNGDGADELFGGYRRYLPFRYYDFFSSPAFLKGSMRIASAIIPLSNEKKTLYNYVFRLMKFGGERNHVRLYNAATSDLMVDFEDKLLVKPELIELTAMLEEVSKLNISGLKKMQLVDCNAILFSALLPKMDIATMAFSLEGRSPFLSKEMLEFAPGLDSNYKISGVTTKYLLRKLAQKYLSTEITSRPKMGFEVPLKKWINTDLKATLNDHLNAADAFYPDYIDKKFVRDLNKGKVRISAEKRAKILYSLLCMEIWHQHYKRLLRVNQTIVAEH